MLVDILFITLGLILCFVGIIGSFLPVLPGPPISWLGILCLYCIPEIPFNYTFLGITLFIAALIFAMDYIIPILGTRYLGGSRSGAIGSTVGLIVGLFFPPLGFLIGPFIGAFLGEILFNSKSNSKHAFKSALGSFVGFLASTFMKALVSFIFLGLFIYKIIEHWNMIF
jgi:uncharacterized protein YqgC (DUF456 family)